MPHIADVRQPLVLLASCGCAHLCAQYLVHPSCTSLSYTFSPTPLLSEADITSWQGRVVEAIETLTALCIDYHEPYLGLRFGQRVCARAFPTHKVKIPENRWSAMCGAEFIWKNSCTGDAGTLFFCERSRVYVGSSWLLDLQQNVTLSQYERDLL